MNPTPAGWPRLSTAIYYDDAAKAIDWLCNAFGFEVRLKVQGEAGRIEHSELTFGDALVMVAQSGGRPNRPLLPPGASPLSINGANTQNIMMFVDNVDDHCVGIDPKTNTLVQGDEARIRQAFLNMKLIAESEGASLRDCVRIVVYVTDMFRFRPIVNKVQEELWGKPPYPPRTIVEVHRLNQDDIMEVEGTFYAPAKK